MSSSLISSDLLLSIHRTVRVKFLQAYLLSGGSNGRLAKGDAMIELDFIDEAQDFDSCDEF